MARLVLDSGAVIALADRDPRARAFLARAVERNTLVLLPAMVVAEVVRGTAGDAPMNRVLKQIREVVPVDEQVARAAGRLLGAAHSTATVDATVVATALMRRPCTILTGDPVDLRRLLAANSGVRVQTLNEV